MKIKHILMASLLLFTFSACSDDDDAADEVVTGTTEVNVVSCDILYDATSQTGDLAWKKRRAAVLNMVATETPDVICFQGQLWNQVIYLEQQLTDYDYVDYNPDGVDATTGYHNTVFYRADKYTLVDNGRFWHSQKPTSASYPWSSLDENRRLTTWVLLKDNTTHAKFYVGSTLLNDGDETADFDARYNSANLNVEQFRELQEDVAAPVILAGDMNASNAADDSRSGSLAPLYEWMQGARETASVTDTKASFNALGKDVTRFTPDNVFLYNASAETFATLDGNYGVQYMSNHYPISCKVKF
jgi:endonuclease/exonuclease/phosphatase family metal-dependent hydrolase